jgi:hypothetical protein
MMSAHGIVPGVPPLYIDVGEPVEQAMDRAVAAIKEVLNADDAKDSVSSVERVSAQRVGR